MIWRPSIPLSDDRNWRGALLFLFVLTVFGRFVIFLDMTGHPAGAQEEWFGSDAWHYAEKAADVATTPDWLIRDGRVPNLLLTREMIELATRGDWHRWADNKLPRGAAAIHLMAFSIGLTNTLALYKILAILSAGLLAVLTAALTARVAASRSAGIIAGLLAASSQLFALLQAWPGPWHWEVLLLAAALLALYRVRDDAANPAEWALFGLLVGVGLWLRPFFGWLLPVGLLSLAGWRVPLLRPCVAALLVGVLLPVGLLIARNVAVESTAAPTVGHAGWALVRSFHPQAALREELPRDALVMEASHGRFPRAALLLMSLPDSRGAAPKVLSRRLRESLGARDEAASFHHDYAARRFPALSLTTLRSDLLMALGWAGVLWLALRRRAPLPLLAVAALWLVHCLLFGAQGVERGGLLLAAIVCFAAALDDAWKRRLADPTAPFLLLMLAATMLAALKIDDQARGPRYRWFEFATSARLLRNAGDDFRSAYELEDYARIDREDKVLRQYWNTMR